MTRIRHTFTALLAIAACSLAATAINAGAITARATAGRSAGDVCPASIGSHRSAQKAAAAATSTAQANAMQAAAVASGEANSALSNPYIEQKVTTPEWVGLNRTKIPAGGF